MNVRERIGERIAEIRKESGISQIELAEKAGVTQNTVYKIEHGKFSVGIDVLDRVITALGCYIDIVKP